MHNLKFTSSILTAAVLLFAASAQPSFAQRLPLAPGVQKVCAIDFTKDEKLPARVEDSALPCLEQAAKTLKENPNLKLVLVGISHPLYDHSEEDKGMEREGEDMTGADIRFSDVPAYRAVNTKAYLTQWLGADPTRIIPTRTSIHWDERSSSTRSRAMPISSTTTPRRRPRTNQSAPSSPVRIYARTS